MRKKIGCYFHPAFVLFLGLAIASLPVQSAGCSENSKAGIVRSTPQTPKPPPPFILPDPPTPVRQAQDVGLGQCAPVLDLMSRQALTGPYDVQSAWSAGDPSHHVFQSIAALRNPANTPPDGFAALIAAPAEGRCDGVVVQVFPLAGDCQSAQNVMLQTGKQLGPMLGTRLMLDAKGNRIILVPGFANTCIAISVDTRFGLAPPRQ